MQISSLLWLEATLKDLPVGQKAWLAVVEANLPIKVVLVSLEKIVMVIRF